jgi:RNA polymerase sigma-70 factor, ECF subfamily
MSDNHAEGPEGWLDRHGDCLYRYALVRLRAPELAADLVQETFLEAFRTRSAFAGRSSERTWLVGILKHKIVDHLRKAGRDRSARFDTAPEASAEAAFDHRSHWRISPSAWTGDPRRVLETREFWEIFSNCLSKLPAGLADAFLLRELDGLSAEEVRQTLNITPANLWARLHRARLLLRQCLDSRWFGYRTSSPPRQVKEPSPS